MLRVSPLAAANAVIWAEAYWVPRSELSRLRLNSDAGSQYTSVRFTETVALHGLSASIGSVGDAYDNATAESTIGLYKNEAVAAGSPFRTGPLRNLSDVETLTMNYVHWYGNERLHSQLGNVTPEEYEQAYYASTTGSPSGDAANKKTA